MPAEREDDQVGNEDQLSSSKCILNGDWPEPSQQAIWSKSGTLGHVNFPSLLTPNTG